MFVKYAISIFVLIAAVLLQGCPAPMATVPDLEGLSRAEAETVLAESEFVLGAVSGETSDTVPAGNVIRQDPAAGMELEPGSSVELVVSIGVVAFVDGNVTVVGKQDGGSWASAYAEIQPAIDAVYQRGGGEVWVAGGVYDEVRTRCLNHDLDDCESNFGALVMHPGVDLYGGFSGVETLLEERDWVANETVVDGSASAADGGPGTHVIYGCDDAVLSGFTVTGGRSESNAGAGMRFQDESATVLHCVFRGNDCGEYGVGGGIAVENGSLLAHDCTFVNNRAGVGGGIAVENGSLLADDCTFVNNRAGVAGGAYVESGTVMMINCVFENNRASLVGGSGGALYVAMSNLVSISESRFASNSAGFGGAVRTVHVSSVTVVDCSFHTNFASLYSGGADFSASDSLSVSGCDFVENSTYDTGILGVFAANASITRCVFDGNAASGSCGVLFLYDSEARVSNCLLTENRGPTAAALVAEASDCNVENCTFSGNVATEDGDLAAISTDSLFRALNSVIWGGSSGISTDETSSTSVRYSLIEGGYEGVGNLDASPLFVDPENGDFRLQPNSPCIDTGSETGAPEQDLRGVDRPQGNGVDMGAYEMVVGETE